MKGRVAGARGQDENTASLRTRCAARGQRPPHWSKN